MDPQGTATSETSKNRISKWLHKFLQCSPPGLNGSPFCSHILSIKEEQQQERTNWL